MFVESRAAASEGAPEDGFISLESVTGHTFRHELPYDEAKHLAMGACAFRPAEAPSGPIPFPEPTLGRPSEQAVWNKFSIE